MSNNKERFFTPDADVMARDYDYHTDRGTLDKLQEIGRELSALAIEGHNQITNFSVSMSPGRVDIRVTSKQVRIINLREVK